jgi:LDH2 family malate/lactate/ureidoglycolate dehydrogenase
MAKWVDVAELLAACEGLLRALGTPPDLAAEVASSLVDAQRVGHESHGVIRLIEYAGFVQSGRLDPGGRARVERQTGATAMIDGCNGWGQPACRLALATARELAGQHGVAAVTVRNCNHVGRIGEYVETLADAGLIGLAWCNAEPAVAPYAGRTRMLGTNPIAAGIPLGAGLPSFVMDFATAAAAEGKLRVARATSASIPTGLVIDAEGRPATDAEAFYNGGALVPFGAHKGYGLSVMVEMLGGALSGNHPATSPRYSFGNGVVLLVLDPAAFVGRQEFADDTAQCAQALRDSPPAVAGQPVLVPGDVEHQQRDARRSSVPVAEQVIEELTRLADRLGAPALRWG